MSADDHQCQMRWGAVAEQMRKHAWTRSGETRTRQSRRGDGRDHGFAKLLKQWKEDQQELETREHQRKVEGAKKIRRIVHENDKNKGLSHVQNEIGRLMHHDEQELSVWEGWQWDDNKGGWLDPDLCSQARREEVECIRRHKMYTRVYRETCSRETGKAPIKTGWAETDKGQPGQSTSRTQDQNCTRQRRHSRR